MSTDEYPLGTPRVSVDATSKMSEVDYSGLTEDGREIPYAVDVDREYPDILERRMFTRSLEASRAGNHQWGLDVGIHQEDWAPTYNIFERDHPEIPVDTGRDSELECQV